MSAEKIPEELIARTEVDDVRRSWLLRIEIRCAQGWAEEYVKGGYAGIRTVPPSWPPTSPGDEQDWRRAWIQIKNLRLGLNTQFRY